jgi:hypothetical protein
VLQQRIQHRVSGIGQVTEGRPGHPVRLVHPSQEPSTRHAMDRAAALQPRPGGTSPVSRRKTAGQAELGGARLAGIRPDGIANAAFLAQPGRPAATAKSRRAGPGRLGIPRGRRGPTGADGPRPGRGGHYLARARRRLSQAGWRRVRRQGPRRDRVPRHRRRTAADRTTRIGLGGGYLAGTRRRLGQAGWRRVRRQGPRRDRVPRHRRRTAADRTTRIGLGGGYLAGTRRRLGRVRWLRATAITA